MPKLPSYLGTPTGKVKPIQEPVETGVFLKVCPRCQMTYSKYDTECKRCARKANKIEQILLAQDLTKRMENGESISPQEQKFLEEAENEGLLEQVVSPEDKALLGQEPFKLSKELIKVRPTFKNRLRFFMDRMVEKGRKITTTYAASKLLRFDNKTDFVNFATDHGVRSLMTADWQEHYAAWDVEDVLKLRKERHAEKKTEYLAKTIPGKILSSLEAAVVAGMAGAGDEAFIELATTYGVKPAKAFGKRPEQMTWYDIDAKALGRIYKLETEAERMEEGIQLLERAIINNELEIGNLEAKRKNWTEIQRWRESNKELIEKKQNLNIIRHELEKIGQHLEREALRIKELVEQHKREKMPAKEASNHRLARILILASSL